MVKMLTLADFENALEKAGFKYLARTFFRAFQKLDPPASALRIDRHSDGFAVIGELGDKECGLKYLYSERDIDRMHKVGIPA